MSVNKEGLRAEVKANRDRVKEDFDHYVLELVPGVVSEVDRLRAEDSVLYYAIDHFDNPSATPREVWAEFKREERRIAEELGWSGMQVRMLGKIIQEEYLHIF